MGSKLVKAKGNDSMKNIELKPCPFCGHVQTPDDGDTVYPSGTGWKETGEYRHYVSFRDVPVEQWCYTVHCAESSGGCGASSSGDSKQEAINKWNTRA